MVFLDGLFGRIFGRIVATAIPTTSLGRIVVDIPLNFSGLFGHIQNPHLNSTCAWWQIGRSMSSLFEPDPCPDHVRVTFRTPPSLNLHNFPRALLPSVSLTLSLYLCVSLFIFWRALEHSCARERVNADQTVHELLKGGSSGEWDKFCGGGPKKKCYFQNTNFFTSKPLCQYAAFTIAVSHRLGDSVSFQCLVVRI